MIVPAPFTRAIFLYGEPITVERRAGVEEARLRVQQALNDLAERAERDFEELWRADRS